MAHWVSLVWLYYISATHTVGNTIMNHLLYAIHTTPDEKALTAQRYLPLIHIFSLSCPGGQFNHLPLSHELDMYVQPHH